MSKDLQQFDLTHAARAGDVTMVIHSIEADPEMPRFLALFEAIKQGNLVCVDALLYNISEDDLKGIHESGGLLLHTALEFQQWALFDVVFPLVNPKEFEESLFAAAVRAGNIACFKKIEPYLPGQWDSAVNIAVRCNHVDILEELLKKCPVNSDFELRTAMNRSSHAMMDLLVVHSSNKILQQALCWAASHCKHVEFIPKLVHCDPKANDSQALKNAVLTNNLEAAKLLAPLSDVAGTLKSCLEGSSHEMNGTTVWLEEWMARNLNERLHQTISSNVSAPTIQRKM